MKYTAIALWALGIFSAVAMLYLTPTSSTTTTFGPNGAVVQATQVGLGMEGIRPAFFEMQIVIIVSLICGTIFWVGHLLSRNRP